MLGISSGLWGLTKGRELYGLVKKAYYSITHGIRFTQVDIDSLTEFNDPFLKQGLSELKRFGVEFGIHGETLMTTQQYLMLLESALEMYYKLSHERLIEHLKNLEELGAKYMVLHASEALPFQLLAREANPSRIVDPWGRPIRKLIEENPFLKKFIFSENDMVRKEIWDFLHVDPKRMIEREKIEIEQIYRMRIAATTDEKEKKQLEEKMKEELKEIENKIKNSLLSMTETSEFSYGPERFAYYVVAKYMQETSDRIWQRLVGRKLSDEEIISSPEKWVPAVAIKYIQGHFNPKLKEYKDPKKYLEKSKIYLCFEAAPGPQGYENLRRIFHPFHLYALAKFLDTPYAGWVLDFEHTLACGIDVKKAVEQLPEDGGKYLKVVHLAFPSPLHGHVPVPLGSEAQEYIYEVLYILRQKGFTDGWLIYERGSEPIEQTIITMKKIKEFLEKNVEPRELPPEFYGFEVNAPEVVRQEEIIKQHALDPLKGLLSVPEEEYTFLSRSALERGRAEQWRKEEMK